MWCFLLTPIAGLELHIWTLKAQIPCVSHAVTLQVHSDSVRRELEASTIGTRSALMGLAVTLAVKWVVAEGCCAAHSVPVRSVPPSHI